MQEAEQVDAIDGVRASIILVHGMSRRHDQRITM